MNRPSVNNNNNNDNNNNNNNNNRRCMGNLIVIDDDDNDDGENNVTTTTTTTKKGGTNADDAIEIGSDDDDDDNKNENENENGNDSDKKQSNYQQRLGGNNSQDVVNTNDRGVHKSFDVQKNNKDDTSNNSHPGMDSKRGRHDHLTTPKKDRSKEDVVDLHDDDNDDDNDNDLVTRMSTVALDVPVSSSASTATKTTTKTTIDSGRRGSTTTTTINNDRRLRKRTRPEMATTTTNQDTTSRRRSRSRESTTSYIVVSQPSNPTTPMDLGGSDNDDEDDGHVTSHTDWWGMETRTRTRPSKRAAAVAAAAKWTTNVNDDTNNNGVGRNIFRQDSALSNDHHMDDDDDDNNDHNNNSRPVTRTGKTIDHHTMDKSRQLLPHDNEEMDRELECKQKSIRNRTPRDNEEMNRKLQYKQKSIRSCRVTRETFQPSSSSSVIPVAPALAMASTTRVTRTTTAAMSSTILQPLPGKGSPSLTAFDYRNKSKEPARAMVRQSTEPTTKAMPGDSKTAAAVSAAATTTEGSSVVATATAASTVSKVAARPGREGIRLSGGGTTVPNVASLKKPPPRTPDLRELFKQNLQLHSKYVGTDRTTSMQERILPRLPGLVGLKQRRVGVLLSNGLFVEKPVGDEFHVTLTDSIHKIIPTKINKKMKDEAEEDNDDDDDDEMEGQEENVRSDEVKNDSETATPYEKALSSFRDMFCRQCSTFDCHHHIVQKFDPGQQAAVAMAYGKMKFNKSRPPAIHAPSSRLEGTSTMMTTAVTTPGLTEQQKFITSRLLMIFGNNSERLGAAMGGRDIARIAHDLPPTPLAKLTTGNDKERTKRTCASDVRERLKDIDQAFYYPCHHAGPCNKKTCTCIKEGFVCTKQCINGKFSRNYYVGCHCRGGCKTAECPCRISRRECDLDTCRCSSECCNKNITTANRKRLLLAPSTVMNAGWGIFTMDRIRKGQFIDEYLGELVEARYAVERERNFLFEYTRDYVAEAVRQGNKTRYMNHSSTPNVDGSVYLVNGVKRIGFFAIRDIPAQSELFYNYGHMFVSDRGKFRWRREATKGNEKPIKAMAREEYGSQESVVSSDTLICGTCDELNEESNSRSTLNDDEKLGKHRGGMRTRRQPTGGSSKRTTRTHPRRHPDQAERNRLHNRHK